MTNIRPATPADQPAVLALWEKCNLTRPWNNAAQDYTRALAQTQSTILVLESAAHIVGSIMVGDDGHRGWVYYLGVAPTHSQRGYGRQLMEAAESWLKARGCPKLNLQVRSENKAVLAFYARLGYVADDVSSLGKRF